MKKEKQPPRPSRQRGVAAIMFAIMLPVLFMFIALGVDGAHFLRATARVGDSVEVASLVLSAAGQMGDDDASKAARKELAENYMQALLPEINANDIKVESTIQVCETNNTSVACQTGQTGTQEPRFIQYQVNGTVTIKSLFPTFSKDLGFGKEVSPERMSLARQYIAESIDVVFVVDFSGSMNARWKKDDETSKIKLPELKDTVQKVAQTVENYTNPSEFDHKNTLSLVPFNYYTVDRKYDPSGSVINECTVTQLQFNREDHEFKDEHIDFQKTMTELFNPKGCNGGDRRESTFFTIHSTQEADNINNPLGSGVNDGMKAGYKTASFEGIIRGAQILMDIPDSKKNPRQLLVMLSDGMDSTNDNNIGINKRKVHADLLDLDVPFNGYSNYCKYIYETLNSQTSRVSKNVSARMAVIGFGDTYLNSNNKENLQDCFGDGNIFDANNVDEVYDKLIELIGESIGRLYTPS